MLITELNKKALDILNNTFGYSSYRYEQEKIINSVLLGNHTLAIMPTGAGKSLCYQLPAAVLEGVTLVICPLIALMNDQVNQLKNIISLVVLIFRNSIGHFDCCNYKILLK